MKPGQVARNFSLSMLILVFGVLFCSESTSQSLPMSEVRKTPETALIKQMVGTWDVEQRMWPGAGMKAINLPPAIAHRSLIGGIFLEEVMGPAPGGDPFTRIAYFNYNAVNQQYEYFSIDTRAPQMMNEWSQGVDTESKLPNRNSVLLYGGNFIAPRWGDARNAAFRYRLVIGPIQINRQVVQLFLTPLSGDNGNEFLGFEYTYTQQR